MRRRGGRRRSLLATGLAAASCAVLLAACGSSSKAATTSTSTSAATSTSSSSSTSAGLARAEAVVEKYSHKPSFVAPGPAFDAKKLDAGKTLFSIPVDSSDQFVQILEDDMAAVAKKVGIHFVDYTNSGSPSAWVRGMQEAVSEHANLIDLLAGINPELLTPQVEAAKAAHIPVVASDAYSLSQAADPAITGVVDVRYGEAGRIMADWTIAQSHGKADALIIESNDVVSSPVEAGDAADSFKKNCPDCKVRTINIPVSDWASQTQTQVESELRAHPNIDYILPVYDSQSQYIAPAITLAGDKGKVHIVTYDGTAFVLKMLQEHDAVVMDVGEDLKWIAWAIMDQEMRIMAGLKPVKFENTPLMIFTSKNVDSAGVPPVQSKGYGNGFVTGYEKLWGLAG
jgi:ribose transport system substrate-binding protein